MKQTAETEAAKAKVQSPLHRTSTETKSPSDIPPAL